MLSRASLRILRQRVPSALGRNKRWRQRVRLIAAANSWGNADAFFDVVYPAWATDKLMAIAMRDSPLLTWAPDAPR